MTTTLVNKIVGNQPKDHGMEPQVLLSQFVRGVVVKQHKKRGPF